MGAPSAEVIALARDIEKYLSAHPGAADTSVGIAQWWLKRQRIEAAVSEVERALGYLVESGRVTRLATGDDIVYQRAPGFAESPPASNDDGDNDTD